MARNTNIYSAHWVGSAGFGTSKLLGGQTITSQKSLGPTNEPTPIQVGNRKTMAVLVPIGRDIKTAIDIGFNELRIKNKPTKCRNTSWGAFAGENRKYSNEVFDYTVPNVPTFVSEKLLVSKGSIEQTIPDGVIADVSEQRFTVAFPDTATGAGQNILDQPWIVIHNQTTDEWWYMTDPGAIRGDGVLIAIPSPVPFILASTLRVWLFFQGRTAIAGGDIPVDIFNGKESDSANVIATNQA